MHSDGKWWAALQIKRTHSIAKSMRSHKNPTGSIIGVDRGLKTLAVVADLEGKVLFELDTNRQFREKAKRLAHAQRSLARKTVPKKKSSKNRIKAAQKVAKIHNKIAEKRKYST